MKNLFFPSFKIYKSELNNFIASWKTFYSYEDEEYNQLMKLQEFTSEDLQKLFIWKNGMILSGRKLKSYNEKVGVHLNTINHFKKQFDSALFASTFKDLTVIWRTFLLHLIDPDTYPIFDQHVYRAFQFISFNTLRELPNDEVKKDECYKQYLIFFKELSNSSTKHSRKELDEALWAFGKALKTYPRLKVNITNNATF